MTTNYPGALDTTTELKNDAADATVTATTHKTHHNNISDAIIAIETELGVLPKGSFASVAAALALLDPSSGGVVVKTPAIDQIILPSADKINLALRAYNAGQTSKILEIRNAAGSVVGYVDKAGNFSAAAIAVGGTPLAALHLSNGTTGSAGTAVVLATSPTITTPTISTPSVSGGTFSGNPNFTGAPTSTTPSASDNTTKIATTAFVQGELSGISSVRTSSFPIDLRNPQQASNLGNVFANVSTFTAYENAHWEFLKDVAGNLYGLVRCPENLAGTPAAKIVLEITANATSGVTRLQALSKNVPDGSSMNPSSLTAETAQDITVPATARLRKKVSFTLTNAPSAGDLLIVRIFHDGTHTNDTLAVNTELHGAWLICDVT